jgi:hypothetical protein
MADVQLVKADALTFLPRFQSHIQNHSWLEASGIVDRFKSK